MTSADNNGHRAFGCPPRHGSILIGQVYGHRNDAHKRATAKSLTISGRLANITEQLQQPAGKSPSAHSTTQVVERKQLVAISLATWYCSVGF
jgi:hypothetical protein